PRVSGRARARRRPHGDRGRAARPPASGRDRGGGAVPRLSLGRRADGRAGGTQGDHRGAARLRRARDRGRRAARAAEDGVSALLASVFTLAFAAQVLRIAVPYVLGAIGGACTERSG